MELHAFRGFDAMQSHQKCNSAWSVDGAVEPADGIRLVSLKLINICGQ